MTRCVVPNIKSFVQKKFQIFLEFDIFFLRHFFVLESLNSKLFTSDYSKDDSLKGREEKVEGSTSLPPLLNDIHIKPLGKYRYALQNLFL